MPNAKELDPADVKDVHNAYVWSVNQAIESDQVDLAEELAESYGRETQGQVPVSRSVRDSFILRRAASRARR